MWARNGSDTITAVDWHRYTSPAKRGPVDVDATDHAHARLSVVAAGRTTSLAGY